MRVCLPVCFRTRISEFPGPIGDRLQHGMWIIIVAGERFGCLMDKLIHQGCESVIQGKSPHQVDGFRAGGF